MTLFENRLKLKTKDEGGKWQMWNRNVILEARNKEDLPCILLDFVSSTGKDGKICTFPVEQDRIISPSIRRKKRWGDCDALVKMWNDSKEKINVQDGRPLIFLDIGSNIGSCVMEMLLSTEAYIISFEADPINAAQISETLLNNDELLRKRVALYPIGLASEKGTSTIRSATNNRGNTIVHSENTDLEKMKDAPSQQFADSVTIQLEALDSIFANVRFEEFHLLLIKMDVQGFECRVIDGGMNVFKHAQSLKTESLDKWLVPQGCSTTGLHERITNCDFTIQSRGYDIYASKS